MRTLSYLSCGIHYHACTGNVRGRELQTVCNFIIINKKHMYHGIRIIKSQHRRFHNSNTVPEPGTIWLFTLYKGDLVCWVVKCAYAFLYMHNNFLRSRFIMLTYSDDGR